MRELDGKFSIHGEEIVNTISGEVVPADEPIMFFRARDRFALGALRFYLLQCTLEGCDPKHLAGINFNIERFEEFSKKHQERMKQPGITGHIRDYRIPDHCSYCKGSGKVYYPDPPTMVVAVQSFPPEFPCKHCSGTGKRQTAQRATMPPGSTQIDHDPLQHQPTCNSNLIPGKPCNCVGAVKYQAQRAHATSSPTETAESSANTKE